MREGPKAPAGKPEDRGPQPEDPRPKGLIVRFSELAEEGSSGFPRTEAGAGQVSPLF